MDQSAREIDGQTVLCEKSALLYLSAVLDMRASDFPNSSQWSPGCREQPSPNWGFSLSRDPPRVEHYCQPLNQNLARSTSFARVPLAAHEPKSIDLNHTWVVSQKHRESLLAMPTAPIFRREFLSFLPSSAQADQNLPCPSHHY